MSCVTYTLLLQIKRDMANFYLSSLIASPQAPWRVYGAAILARHINHAAASCLLQRQQHQYHHQRMLSQGGDDDDANVSSSSSLAMAMAQDGSRRDSYEGVSRFPLDNTLSLLASMLAPPPPSPSLSSSSSSHALPNVVDLGGAVAGRLLTERDLSDALSTPFLVTSLAVTTASTTSTTTADASATNNDTNNDLNALDIAPALVASVLPPTPLSPPVHSLTLTQPMRQLVALFLVRVWQFPIRLDAAAAATTTAVLSSSSLSPSSSMLTMIPEPLCLFEGKRLAEVGRSIGTAVILLVLN